MGKIKALYTNEMIKISRRPSVIIVAILTLVIAAAIPFIMRIVYNSEFAYAAERDEPKEFQEYLTEAKAQLQNANMKKETKDVTLEVGGKEKTIAMTYYTGNDFIFPLVNTIIYEDMLKNYNFEKYPVTLNWLTLNSLTSYRRAIEGMITLETTEFEERDSEWLADYEKHTAACELLREALMKHDYELLCKGIETCSSANSFDGRITVDIVRRLAATDPKGELDYSEASYLMGYLCDKEENTKMLESGLAEASELPRILSEERKEILQNTNKILAYKFEHHATFGGKSIAAMMADFYSGQIARFALIVLLVLIAASSVAQELATGSIKSLIIAPVKRWKIFTAKLLSIITWMIAASVFLTLVSIVATGIAFGFENLPPYLYVSNGNVVEMPFVFAKILIDLIQNIPAFFYAFAGFMISCFTKNSGVSVGVSIGLLLFHEVPEIFHGTNLPQKFLDFTPLANMDLAEKLFPYVKLMVNTEEMEINVLTDYGFRNPLWSMVLYIVVMVFTILLIAYEEFTKKDIA